jgi:hypothetical protein
MQVRQPSRPNQANPGHVFYYRRFNCRYTTRRSDHAASLWTTSGTTFDIANPS